MAVPIPIFKAIVLPPVPRAYAARPTPANKAVPSAIPETTVSPFSSTGSHASPTFSNSKPIMAIAPVKIIAAAATSAMTTTPRPRFFARDFSLGESWVLTVVSIVPVALESVFIAVVALPRLEIPFNLENTSRATTKPPRISKPPIIRATLSTPLQSPCLIASQFVAISRMMVVKP